MHRNVPQILSLLEERFDDAEIPPMTKAHAISMMCQFLDCANVRVEVRVSFADNNGTDITALSEEIDPTEYL